MAITRLAGDKFVGLSTDTKPTTGIPDGAVFYETDTKKAYIFSGGAWVDLLTDAHKLQGTAISTTAPTDGDVLTYNATAGEWQPTAPTGGGGAWTVKASGSFTPTSAGVWERTAVATLTAGKIYTMIIHGYNYGLQAQFGINFGNDGSNHMYYGHANYYIGGTNYNTFYGPYTAVTRIVLNEVVIDTYVAELIIIPKSSISIVMSSFRGSNEANTGKDPLFEKVIGTYTGTSTTDLRLDAYYSTSVGTVNYWLIESV